VGPSESGDNPTIKLGGPASRRKAFLKEAAHRVEAGLALWRTA